MREADGRDGAMGDEDAAAHGNVLTSCLKRADPLVNIGVVTWHEVSKVRQYRLNVGDLRRME